MQNKQASAEKAVSIIQDGDTVAISGFVGIGTPDELLVALEKRFLETGHPRDLTLVFAAAPGDGKEKGLNRLAHKGLVKRAIGGHWSLVPKLAEMAMQNEIEAYNFPLGCVSQLYRVIAGGKPGLRTKVGLRTFVDPRISGGKINDKTTEDLIDLDVINEKEWLFYKSFPIDVALLRGTTADVRGNTSMEREVLILDVTSSAMAAHNSDGVVLVQVERIAESGSIVPKTVSIPGALVDCVVVAKPENHMQTYATPYEHAFTGQMRVPMTQQEPAALDERKVIARRAAFELPVGGVINLGIGMPETVARVAGEEGLLDQLTLTAEPGTIGGMPQGGLNFGASLNPDAVIPQNTQFDFYDGGGIDLACLGMAQIDQFGNVNVSKFGPKFAGAGGFINISQNASKLVFTGTFTACGLKLAIEDGQLNILQEGSVKKFVKQVEHITFSGELAAERKQPVLYVTERCVFQVCEDGLELIEVAKGIDLQKDILAHMEFEPVINHVKEMDPRLFLNQMMNLKTDLIDAPIEKRVSLQSDHMLNINLKNFEVRSVEDLAAIKQRIEQLCEPLKQKVDMIAWYDGFSLPDELEDTFSEMLIDVEQRFYRSSIRYTRDPFIRQRFGAMLKKRDIPTRLNKDSIEIQAVEEDVECKAKIGS